MVAVTDALEQVPRYVGTVGSAQDVQPSAGSHCRHDSSHSLHCVDPGSA